MTCYKSNAALSFNLFIESIFYMLAVCYILVSNKIMTESNDMRLKPDFNFRCLKKKIRLSGITVTFETNYILDHFKTIQWKTKLADMFNEIYRNLWFLEEYSILFEMVWEPLYEGIHSYKRYNTCIINTLKKTGKYIIKEIFSGKWIYILFWKSKSLECLRKWI